LVDVGEKKKKVLSLPVRRWQSQKKDAAISMYVDTLHTERVGRWPDARMCNGEGSRSPCQSALETWNRNSQTEQQSRKISSPLRVEVSRYLLCWGNERGGRMTEEK
jgi:hypothetical protein